MRTKFNFTMWAASLIMWALTAISLIQHKDYRDVGLTLGGMALSIFLAWLNYEAIRRKEQRDGSR